MKKYFYIGFFIAIASMCSANAGYLSLEDDSDIGRVYRNVANFCNYHHDQLLELKNKNFNLNDCQSSFDEIINGNSDLITEFHRAPKYFVRDLLDTINYVKKNGEAVKKNIGVNEYKYFSSGLVYLDKILSLTKGL